MEDNDFKKYNHVNPVVVEFLHQLNITDKSVLDVGCWTGSLGHTILRDTNCQFDGVDSSVDAGIEATKKGYRYVYNINLNQISDLNEIRNEYDVIVFGDVLEHTIDPDKVLKLFSNKLKTGGSIIVSLPNIGFLLYRVLHLLGRWDYTLTGVMDSTHLRFFTLKTMQHLFADANLLIIHTRGLNVVKSRYRILTVLGILFPSIFALQIVFLLKKRST